MLGAQGLVTRSEMFSVVEMVETLMAGPSSKTESAWTMAPRYFSHSPEPQKPLIRAMACWSIGP